MSVDFDPRREGPVEVANRLAEWVSVNIFRILGVGLAGVVTLGVGVERSWWTIPEVPTAIWVLLSGALAGVVLGAYPIYRVLLSIWHEDVIRLVELDPRSGDLSVWSVSEERFRDLRVVDHKGREQDPSTFLNGITLGSGERGYEVDHYDHEHNVAVASWMAGARNREIRRHERAIDYVKRELSVEADKTLDQLINSGDVLRQQGKAVGLHLIKTIEGIQTPDSEDTALYDQMFDVLAEHDATDDILTDGSLDDPEDAIRAFTREHEDDESGSESDSETKSDREVSPARERDALVGALVRRNGHAETETEGSK